MALILTRGPDDQLIDAGWGQDAVAHVRCPWAMSDSRRCSVACSVVFLLALPLQPQALC